MLKPNTSLPIENDPLVKRSFRFRRSLLTRLAAMARSEKRNVNNLMEVLLEKALAEYESASEQPKA